MHFCEIKASFTKISKNYEAISSRERDTKYTKTISGFIQDNKNEIAELEIEIERINKKYTKLCSEFSIDKRKCPLEIFMRIVGDFIKDFSEERIYLERRKQKVDVRMKYSKNENSDIESLNADSTQKSKNVKNLGSENIMNDLISTLNNKKSHSKHLKNIK